MTTPRLMSPGPVTVLPCKLWTIALQPTSPLVQSDFEQFYFKFNFFFTHTYRGVCMHVHALAFAHECMRVHVCACNLTYTDVYSMVGG